MNNQLTFDITADELDIFLEDVNNVFNSGEVPNLWENEEKDEINKEMQEEADRLGIEDKYKFFVQRI